MLEIILHALEHGSLDSLKLVPFLFLTYLAMEYLEHKTGSKTEEVVRKAGHFGPVVGSLLGALPQCGFSAAASNLYAGRVISMGTLIAIYLSTSDEMLPIMISEKVSPVLILKVLGVKILIGMLAGFIIDFVMHRRKKEEHVHIHEMCEEEKCHCEKGIFHSAVNHTLHIFVFILLVSIALELVLGFVGEDALAGLLLNRPVLGPIVSGIVGLLPNCAASVVITQLYLQGAMGFGTMMAGLLVGAGVGILVLCRVNHHKKENLQIVGLLYIVGVLAGIMLELL